MQDLKIKNIREEKEILENIIKNAVSVFYKKTGNYFKIDSIQLGHRELIESHKESVYNCDKVFITLENKI